MPVITEVTNDGRVTDVPKDANKTVEQGIKEQHVRSSAVSHSAYSSSNWVMSQLSGLLRVKAENGSMLVSQNIIDTIPGFLHIRDVGQACKEENDGCYRVSLEDFYAYLNYTSGIGEYVRYNCNIELAYGSKLDCGYLRTCVSDLKPREVLLLPVSPATINCSRIYKVGREDPKIITYRIQDIVATTKREGALSKAVLDDLTKNRICGSQDICVPDPNKDREQKYMKIDVSSFNFPSGRRYRRGYASSCDLKFDFDRPDSKACVSMEGFESSVNGAYMKGIDCKTGYPSDGVLTCSSKLPISITFKNTGDLDNGRITYHGLVNCNYDRINGNENFSFVDEKNSYKFVQDRGFSPGRMFSAYLPRCSNSPQYSTSSSPYPTFTSPAKSSSSNTYSTLNPQYNITTTDNNAASSLRISNPFSVSSNYDYGTQLSNGFRDGALSGAAMALVPSSMQPYVGPAMMLFNYKTGIMSMVNWATGEAVNIMLDEASSKEFKEDHGNKVRFAARLATSAAIGGVYGVGAALGGEVAGLAVKELPNLADKAGEVISSVAVNGAKTSHTLAREYVIGSPGYGGSQATGLLGTGINFMLKGLDSVAGGVNALRDTGDGLYKTAKDQATAARSHISSKWRDFAERARVAAGGVGVHGL